jgi:choline dehydrogenase-like flavoprotein
VGAAVSGALLQLADVRSRPVVEDEADVVIVGSGAAGATAARVLTEAGVEVIVLEEGPSVPDSELRRDVYSGMKRVWRDLGAQVAEGRAFIPLLQGRCVGGSTAINSAIIHRLPEKIHDVWRREHGASEVLTRERLERAWDALDSELGVAPPPDAVLGENNRLMLEGAKAVGISAHAIRRSVRDCQGSGRCLQGCPTSRKQSMNVSYVPRAIAAGARVYATCRVERVTAKAGRADAVAGRFVDPRTSETGPRLVARARHAVLVAASAIQTPLLLRASGLRSKLIGRRFQAHPGTGVMGVFDRPVNMWFGATQGAESTHFWDERMKFETIALPPELGAVRLPGLGAELARDLAGYGRLALWAVQVRARAHGRVRRSLLGRTVVEFDPTDEDMRTLKTGVKRISEMMFAAGAREILPGVHGLPDRVTSMDEIRKIDALPDDPRILHCIATHLFGTATMGTDPRASVVGSDGQCHELPGLHVVDSSIFPTNIGVNPQHSIAGVAWVLAERIAARIRG